MGYMDDWTPNQWQPDPGAAATPGAKPSGTAGKFLSSPGGAALINAAGGAASAYGAAKSADANRQQSASQFAASMYDKQANEDRVNAQNALTPLGESQNFAASNRSKANLAAAMGKLTGMGGHDSMLTYDPSTIEKNWGDTSTMESLAQHAKQLSAINPNAPKENFSNYGYDPTLAQGFENNIDTYQGGQQQGQANQRALIQRALDNDANGEKQQSSDPSSGIWHKIAKYGGMAAGIAAIALTGGAAAPAIVPMLLAGGGAAASAFGNGGGAKDALTAGIMGGATQKLAGRYGTSMS